MIGIKLIKGWNFSKYDNGSPINSIQQIVIHKKEFRIQMLQKDKWNYEVVFSKHTPKKYDSFVLNFGTYQQAKIKIKLFMEILKRLEQL